MGDVAFHGQGGADGVDDAVLGLTEAHAGEGGAVEHAFAGLEVLTVGISLTDVAGHELHGSEVEGVGEGGSSDAAEGFHGVHEGVNAGHGGHAGGQANGEFGVEENDVGVHVVRDYTLLAAVLGVGEHGNVGEFTAGASSGGDEDHGQAGVGNEVHTEVLVDRTFVGHEHSGSLGGVEGRAATDADEHFSAESLGGVGAGLNGIHAGFEFSLGEEFPFHAASGEGIFKGLLHADLGKAGVGHDEGLLAAKILHDIGSLLDGARTVDEVLHSMMIVNHVSVPPEWK